MNAANGVCFSTHCAVNRQVGSTVAAVGKRFDNARDYPAAAV
jgi:hypothetical protein